MSSLDGALPLPNVTVTLQFGDDGTAFGTDGCNRFNTTYTQDGANLTFGRNPASTMIACPDSIMNQASAYMRALTSTNNFVADQRQLILRNGDQIVATFVAVSGDLAGTSWEVISYNNGRDAVVGLLLGTEITADFGEGGELTGNAGCNNYFTGYKIEGNAITIDPPGSTRRFCPEPPGVMDQEAAFLAALQSSATFRLSGSTLEMRTAGDQIAIIADRAP